MAVKILPTPKVKTLIWIFSILVILCLVGIGIEISRIRQIDAFNAAVSSGKTPATEQQSFAARFSTAFWLTKNRRFKESTLLFNQLAETATPAQKSAIQYNLGNIFFMRGLAIGGSSMTVRNETEYLLRQAMVAYQQSLRLENRHWDARHNLDRILTLLPETPTPGVGESDMPGLIMGNIPVGLP